MKRKYPNHVIFRNSNFDFDVCNAISATDCTGLIPWAPNSEEQAELTEPVREAITSILGIDASSLQVINRPPTRSKPIYMKVWEARKADGLDYDPDDERQQAFLSEITKYNIRSIE